ncbi:head GIN domain-containing protein [Janthinobacterium sp. HH01]|uniref:head GIN domain-containing protein n=1 Tax=Janthinobacterium sp. HH01 TaxID=1198452 RepID=UPI000346C74C|nr:head GIN domain-containing protein [Janthinobacterium sp. HH01]
MAKPFIRSALRTLFLSAGLLAVAAPASVAWAGPLSWFHGERVQGSGKIVKQNRELGHFTSLATSVSGNVEIRMGNTESISIETDDNLQALIETVVDNGTLRIRPTRKDVNLESRTMKIVVQARSIEKIAVTGSGSVDVDKLRAESLTFDVGGSGSINARNLESESVAIALGGSGNLKTSGNTERLQISIGGSGRVQAGQLAARDATVSIGGSGQATVWAKQTLNLSVAGSGDIAYYGDPQLTKSVMGSGTIKRLGASPQ